MQRRPLIAGLALAALAHPSWAAPAPDFAALEQRAKGRLGFFALDTADGRTLAHRADERFATASTFKLLLAAHVAQGVDTGRWRWGDEIALTARDRVPHSPAFDRLLPAGRASLAALVRGILVESDNPCANLLLRHCCGTPQGQTQWLREQGDAVTRLDRWETELNDNAPGDVRDTSTPRAFAMTTQKLLLGPGLSHDSQAHVLADMADSRTGLTRLRAGVPEGWRVVDKTGTGNRGAVNDVALVVPPGGRAPWVVAAFQSDSTAETDPLAGVLADAMRAVVCAWG